MPKAPKGKKSVPWRKDPKILHRLTQVEPLYCQGVSNREIARRLGVNEATIRVDVKRLLELWVDRVGAEQNEHRARAVARLNDIVLRSLRAAEFDEHCERAVLFDEEMEGEDGESRRVYRPEKGATTFRGNKSSALNTARQALMDQAKLLGLVVDKVAPTDGEGKDLSLAELCRLAAEEDAANP